MQLIIEMEPDNGMSLRQAWIEGTDENSSFDLTCGAGLGSPMVYLSVTVGGVTRRFRGNISSPAIDLVNQIVAEMEA